MKLYKGNCLEEMRKIPDGSIDAIITDIPYGTTKCKWDSIIPFEPMWEQLNRIIKLNGAIVLFGSEPFSSALRMSNIKNFKYDWIWRKNTCTGISQSAYQPMKEHEIISVFYNKKSIFNKQKMRTKSEHIANCAKKGLERKSNTKSEHNTLGGHYGGEFKEYVNPRTVLEFNTVNNRDKSKVHPTQKPVALMEYLIKTYTNDDELVLDFTMGSGTTGVACKNLNRDFIGIELDEEYFNISKDRIENHVVKQQE